MLEKLWLAASKACNTCVTVLNINGSKREADMRNGLELHPGDTAQISEDTLLRSIITHLGLDYDNMRRVDVIYAIHDALGGSFKIAMEAGASFQYIVPRSLQLYLLTQVVEMIGDAIQYNEGGHVGIGTSDPFNANPGIVGSVYSIELHGICPADGWEFLQ